MKELNILGRKLTFKLEPVEARETHEISPRDIVNKRIFILICILFIIPLSSKLFLIKENLSAGDTVKKDIVAPFSVKYNDKLAKDEIVQKVIEESQKEYIFLDDVAPKAYINLEKFFISLEKLGSKPTDVEVEDFISKFDNVRKETVMKLAARRDKKDIENRIKNKFEEFYSIGIKNDENYLDSLKENLTDQLSLEELDVFSVFLVPNFIYDDEKTKASIKERVESVNDVIVQINAGETILKKGSTVTRFDIEKLKKLGIYGELSNSPLILGNIFFLIVISTLFFIIVRKFLFEEILKKSYYYSTIMAVFGYLILARFTRWELFFLLPVDALFLLLGILIGEKYTLVISSFVLFFSLAFKGVDQLFFMTSVISLVGCIYGLKKIKNRAHLVNTGLYLGLLKSISCIAILLVSRSDFISIAIYSSQLFFSGVLSGMLTIALLPYFERTFNILTNMKLLELGDLSHPLLRQLAVNAPGTFQHSMMVATLSENAADAIGANATFARVAAYYHDIGKMKRPNFYVENQHDAINPHENLTPSLSTLIITAHTRDGIEMGKEYKIPKEIRDIMTEHQGTTLLAYFYNKAKKENPILNENDYRYEGPKPRTKESAIIMLADSIEAAVRSLDEKTPTSIEKMLRKIIAGKIEDNQLSEADLTFKEIEIIIKTFTKVLMGIHHVRIKYPDIKPKHKS